MDGSNDPGFQSVVILGLKTALLEAQDEINRIAKERDEARRKILQMIQTNGKYQVEVINSNELATKLKSELKKVRKELEAHKKELEKQKLDLENVQRQKENENYNWRFQYDQLKSLLDIKTELLESLNVRGDKVNKNDLIDYRANYKIMMKNLKMVVKNQPCYPDRELLEDIQNLIYKIESGKSVSLSKYLAKKVKPIKKEVDKCNDNLDGDNKYTVKVHDDSGIRTSTPVSSSNNSVNANYKCSENFDPNAVQNNFSMKLDDLLNFDKSISRNTNLVAEKTNTVRDEPKINIVITNMPDLRDETIGEIVSAEPSDKKDIDTISDSDSDSTSGFFDGETEAESPPSSTEFVSHTSNTPSPENHTLAMCMPDLLSSSDPEKNTFNSRFSTKNAANDLNTTSKLSISVLNSKLKSTKLPSPQKKKPDTKSELKVKNILEEMNEMRTTMTGQVSILKRYYDDNLNELNSCFKRPESVLPSRRKSVQKNRKNVDNATDVIPKRSSQLVKCDPCSRKLNPSATSSNDDEIRENELIKRLDSASTSRINEIAIDSSKKSDLDRVAPDPNAAKKLDVGEISSAEKSSSFADVTNSFESATEPPSQLLTEASVRDTIDLKNRFNIIYISSSNDEAAAKEIENETNHSTNIPQTNAAVPENSSIQTLPQITLEPDACNSKISNYTKRPQEDITNKKSNNVFEECIDKISSQNTSCSNVENPGEVSTAESNVVVDPCTDIVSLGGIISNKPLISTSNVLNRKSVERSSKSPEAKTVERNNHYADLLNEKRPQNVAIEKSDYAFEECISNISSQNASSSNAEKPDEVSTAESNAVTDPCADIVSLSADLSNERLISISSISNSEPVEKSSKSPKTEKAKRQNRHADLAIEKRQREDVAIEKNNTVFEERIDNTSSQNASSSIVENLHEVSTEESDAVSDLFADISNEKPISASKVSNRKSAEKSSKSSKTEKVKSKSRNSDLVKEKLIKRASKKSSPRNSAKLKQVSSSDEQQTPFTCEANTVVASVPSSCNEVSVLETGLSSIQQPVETSQVTNVPVASNDINVSSNSDFLDTASNDDPKKYSCLTQQLLDSSTVVPKKDAIILGGSNESSVPENNSAIDSTPIKEQGVEEISKKRQYRRPKKTSKNVQNQDDLLKTSCETEQSTDSTISKTNENISALEHPEKSSVPENNAKNSSTDDSNLTDGKTSVDAPKKRGRPKKASCDATDEAKSTTKITKTSLENSNESFVLENNTKSNDDSNLSEEKIPERVSKKRGRPRKASLDSQHSSNKSETSSPTKAKRNVAVLEKPEKSPVLENSVESNPTDANSAAEGISESSPKKRKCGRPKKMPLVPKSEPQPDSGNLETARVSRRKSAAESCETKLLAENVQPSCTMNNGMERRKRKGKYVEILDSLKCKPKRRKSDYDAVSLELTDDDAKPRQRRGRKRKASLPVETFENGTQTNWSPPSESTISIDANNTPEIETDGQCKPEEVYLAKASPQKIHNQQIDEKISPPDTKGDGAPISFEKISMEAEKLGISTPFVNDIIVTSPELRPNVIDSALLSSSHLITSSGYHLPRLLDNMSKIIEKKVLSMVMAKSFHFMGESPNHVELKSKTARDLTFEKETLPQSSLLNINQRELVPVAVVPVCARNPSSVAAKDLETDTASSIQTSDDRKAIIPVDKPNLGHASKLPDSSSEPKDDEELISKPTISNTSQLEETLVAKLAQQCVSNSFDFSSESKNDAEIINHVIPVDELKEMCNHNPSSIKTENGRESISISSTQTTSQPDVICVEKSKPNDDANSPVESELKTDEGSIRVQATNHSETMPAPNLKEENISRSSESENEESVEKSVKLANQPETIPASESKQADVFSSTSKQERTKSIFDCESNESPTKMVPKKVCFLIPEVSDERCSSPSSNIDSDDDSPIEMSSKIMNAALHTLTDNDESSHLVKKERDEPIWRLRYDEEASNSSALSSQVSELDVNVELVSQFESVRTPPKVKDLFDSSDDENSKSDVFSIIEEMTSVSRSLFERQKELAAFSLRSPPLIESAVILSPSKCQTYSPTRNTFAECQPYSPSQNGPVGGMQIKDDDDSEDETLVIAEDDLVNDSNVDGIEINRFNCHDTNPGYASPAYTKSLTPSNVSYNSLSHQITNCSRPDLNEQLSQPVSRIKIANESQASASNPIKFQFYKENVELENQGGASRALSPFETVWENLKSLYVRSPDVGEDVMLIPCYQSVAHLAFFYTNKKPNVRRWNFSLEKDKMAYVEMLITNYLEHVRENEYVAVKNFKVSAHANPVTIATALTNMVMKNSNRHMKELKETLGYLSNLSIDLETDHKDFITLLQTKLKEKMFSKTWQVDNNSGINQVSCIIAMSVLFTMLSQRSNDVKSVKDLLLEGLCSWKYRGHPVAFGVLNACPTIFNDASRDCLLTQIILFTLINHSMERNLDLYKVPEVREMIGQHYKVKLGDKAAEDHVKEAMLLFNDDTWVDAMVLLCKRKQFLWSYTNVVMKYLIQIVNKWKEEDFNEMIMIKSIQALHKIVQCCPIKAVNSSNKTKKRTPADSKYPTYNIGSIIKSLSEVLHCPKGSRELRETVAIAICNISHLDFEICQNILSKWEPPEGAISNKALEEMNVIMKRCRIVNPNVPNKWLQTLLPRECWSAMNPTRRTNNFAPRNFDGAGGDSTTTTTTTTHQQRQHQPPKPKFHEKNSAFSEPPKQKKKKKKGKKNRNNREQTIS